MGAGWCPPGIIGIGIGGTPEKAMLLAKESLMAPVDIHELKARPPAAPLNRAEELRLELYEKVNALGVGAQGLGGLTTVLDVKVLDYPLPRRQPAGGPGARTAPPPATATSTWMAPARPRSSRRSWKTGRPSPGRRTSSRPPAST